jgi:serine/threonine-protein kinase RsbW
MKPGRGIHQVRHLTSHLTRGAAVESDTPSFQPGVRQDQIELTIPARAEYVAVVRLTIAGVAGRMSFSYDASEDLKVAVSEACTVAVLSGGPKVQVRLEMASDRLGVRVTYQASGRSDERGQERELAMLLIGCLMDEVRTERRGPQHVIWMTKRLQR